MQARRPFAGRGEEAIERAINLSAESSEAGFQIGRFELGDRAHKDSAFRRADRVSAFGAS